MTNEIIKYFKYGFMKSFKRPNCRRYLSLWDDEIWKRKNNFNNVAYINSNDFLFFLYETKHDLCCIDDNNGKVIRNAIDEFFNLLFDIGRFNCLPYRIYNKDKFKEIFQDLIQKINKWNYWKKGIILRTRKFTTLFKRINNKY